MNNRTFVNLSVVPSVRWTIPLTKAAEEYGAIVNRCNLLGQTRGSKTDICDFLEKIMQLNPGAVLFPGVISCSGLNVKIDSPVIRELADQLKKESVRCLSAFAEVLPESGIQLLKFRSFDFNDSAIERLKFDNWADVICHTKRGFLKKKR